MLDPLIFAHNIVAGFLLRYRIVEDRTSKNTQAGSLTGKTLNDLKSFNPW